MDRKSLIILLISAAVLAAWYPLTSKIFPPKPAPPARSNPVARANPSTPQPTATIKSAEAATNAPSPAITKAPPREETTLTLDSPDATYIFTSIGGGFKQ